MPLGNPYSQTWVQSASWEIASTIIEPQAHSIPRRSCSSLLNQGDFRTTHKATQVMWVTTLFGVYFKKKHFHYKIYCIYLLKGMKFVRTNKKSLLRNSYKGTSVWLSSALRTLPTPTEAPREDFLVTSLPWVHVFQVLPLRLQQGFLAKILSALK